MGRSAPGEGICDALGLGFCPAYRIDTGSFTLRCVGMSYTNLHKQAWFVPWNWSS
ncbi:MAG: hypothetical protein ACI841_002244, partial [Planctomycetota bacterium]